MEETNAQRTTSQESFQQVSIGSTPVKGLGKCLTRIVVQYNNFFKRLCYREEHFYGEGTPIKVL